MKKAFGAFMALVIISVVCVGLAGCIIRFDADLRVKGNGQVETRELSLSETLSGVKTLTSIDILLDPALKDKAVLEGESNLLDLTEVKISAGVLTVNYKPDYIISNIQPVTLRVPEISGGLLETTSSGSIRMLGSDALKGEFFELNSSSSGSITVAVETGTLRAVATSSGNITVTGSAGSAEIEITSSGSFNGFDCKMQNVSARHSSSGDANVCVSGELSGSISSSGDIVYVGSPNQVNVSTSSSGRAVEG
jgi:hypothetical protein